MERWNLGKQILCQLLVMSFVLTGCLPSDIGSAQRFNVADPDGGIQGGGFNSSGAGPGGPDIGNGTSLPPKVEIRHLIEPNLSSDPNYSSGTGHAGGGSYVRKLTLPKNFAGRLYVAGINMGTLTDRHVKVRFKFGLNREAVTIPATVTRAPGITPQTDISVLVLDLRSEPFRSIRLPYDLFDYNDYNFENGDTPTQNNRDTGLYCRGLRIQDDPTFQGVGACDGLQTGTGQPEEQCLYAYAKVLDQGLIQQSGSVRVPLTPSLSQVKSIVGGSYFQDFLNPQLRKPLPDTMPTVGANVAGNYRFSQLAVPANSTDARNILFENTTVAPLKSIWDPELILGSFYYYRGPYRLVNSQEWHFRFPELDGNKRLFRENSWVEYPLFNVDPLPDDNQNYPLQNRIYFNSYLFPLATQLELQANIPHLASSSVLGVRTEQSLSQAGKTLWMDGANARAQSRNADLEHIGSCNVSATMEILARDANNTEYVISLANDVKLQLVRPTTIRTDSGDEVLFSNFKSCASNSSCGGSECCFNNRCWDETLVSQCFDNSSNQGNRIIGEACSTDLECSSLCCNRSSGQCAPHNTINTPAVLCSKPIGDSCIAKEWCQKSPVTKCLIVRTGTNSVSGEPTCRQQCYVTQEYGDCKNGTCTPPLQEPIPTFDPNAPGACNNAVPAPNF